MEKQSKSRKKAGSNGGNRTYLKIIATFKCCSDKCGKTWNSAHAWGREDCVLCEFCGSKANIPNVVDENLELDIYHCPTEGCGNMWESIHDEDATNNEQECDCCGAGVVSDGIQQRFGRHFYFKCSSDICQVEWEDFSMRPQHTQRCTKCRSRGDIRAIHKIRAPRRGNAKDDDGGERGVGQHNAENCDMCQALRAQGKWTSCIPLRKVKCQVQYSQFGGSEAETIVDAK